MVCLSLICNVRAATNPVKSMGPQTELVQGLRACFYHQLDLRKQLPLLAPAVQHQRRCIGDIQAMQHQWPVEDISCKAAAQRA